MWYIPSQSEAWTRRNYHELINGKHLITWVLFLPSKYNIGKKVGQPEYGIVKYGERLGS